MLCLVPLAWISFSFLNLTENVTGGLISNFEDFLASIGSVFGPLGMALSIVGSVVIGLLMIFLFPIHWALWYQPENVMLLIGLMLPWILCCGITAAIFAKTPQQGIWTSLFIGLGYLIPMMILYGVAAVLGGALLNAPGIALGAIDGLSLGLTDLPYLLAVFTGILEGCLIGAVFGAFFGSIRYKPEEEAGVTAVKTKKKKAGSEAEPEPTLEKSENFCINCGATLLPGEDYCPDCGTKVK
jgi:hypothetical protein